MNRTILIISVTVFVACSKQTDKQESTDHITEEIQERSTGGLPNGNWHYTAYTDSTIYHKSVFRYSWSCASFAYQIIYDRSNSDSIKFIGYNEQVTLPLTKKDENTYWAGDTIQHWILKFSRDYSQLNMLEYIDPSYANKADPKTYNFKLTEKKITRLSKHFVSNIFKGSYINDTLRIELTDNLKKSEPFTDYYELNGFGDYQTYSIVINFFEMVPQMDLINFYDKRGAFVKQYHWKFNNEELFLFNVQEIYDEGGDFSGGKPTDVAFILKRRSR